MAEEKVQLAVAPPPNEIFVQESRAASTGEKAFIHLRDRLEFTEKGIEEWVKGAPFPRKGFPTPPAIYSLNQAKRMIMEFAGMLQNPFIALGVLFSDKNILMARFNRIFDRLFAVHRIKEEMLCPTARSFYHFLFALLKTAGFNEEISKDFAFNVCQILQYDDAYRYRVQDVLTEANIQELRFRPRKELKRLINVWIERDSIGVSPKMKMLITPFTYLLYIPKYYKAFTKNVHLTIGMKRDEADWYWVCLRGDYKYAGMTREERMVGIIEPTVYEIDG